MADVWRQAQLAVQDGEAAVLVMVAHSVGSVPGKTGAKMLVTAGQSAGTVGGGSIEEALIQEARKGGPRRLVEVVHDGVSAPSICSGSQVFAFIPLAVEHLDALVAIVQSLDDRRFGVLKVTDDAFCFEPDASCTTTFSRQAGGWAYRETLGYRQTLTVVGGGHVSLELCRVVSRLPFKLRVLDNRREVSTMAENRCAHELLTVDYGEIAAYVPHGEGSFVAIMTHGHASDELVLEQLAPLSLTYLGMMGSAAKVAGIYERLASRGISRADLERVHAPIGIPIGSKTPPEIAISIAAEIVKVNNRGSRRGQSQ